MMLMSCSSSLGLKRYIYRSIMMAKIMDVLSDPAPDICGIFQNDIFGYLGILQFPQEGINLTTSKGFERVSFAGC